MERIALKKRRGLHTIIGAVFFVLVMGSTIGYVTYSMNLVDNLAYQIDVKQDNNLNRQSEEFKIIDVSVVNNEFNLTVKNTGTLPINVTKMWAKNMTAPLWNQTSYQINQLIAPGQSLPNIGQGTGLVAMDSESYSLKLLTTRGNALETQVVSTTNQPLEMTLFTTPANPLSGQNVTLLYAVKNNLTEGIVQSLVPVFENPVDTTGSATAVQQGSTTPASVEGLKPGETAFFEATYYVTGGNTEKITFNATVANAVQGNFVRDTSIIDIAPVSESAINEILGGQVGVISMNFTSFEACKTDTADCRLGITPTPWERAWNLTQNSPYVFRLNFTNSGSYPIIIEKATHLLAIPTKSGGGGNPPSPFFIRNTVTTTDEDGSAYTDLSIILPANQGATTVMYFGSKNAAGTPLQNTDTNGIVVSVLIVLFGYEDRNGSGTYNAGDTQYGQTIPFQAYRLHA